MPTGYRRYTLGRSFQACMSLLDEQFTAWESLIEQQSLRVRRPIDGVVELRYEPAPAEQLAGDLLQERWAQRYVQEEFERLGFTEVDGPFGRGPDYRVFCKRRWAWAEVETRWKNYLLHQHHFNPAFDGTKYLVLLSAEDPPANARSLLPPKIVHIDREHFLGWYEKAAKPELLGKAFQTRAVIVAGAMQDHWTTICSDIDREMSVCPDCDSCAYFGNGMFGEATPFFHNLAARLLLSTGLSKEGKADLRQVESAILQRFVEENPPGD
jgi:hypothetical protein